MPSRRSRSPFVGRAQELATLQRHLAAARQGEGGVVLVSGEPGIGKTRLLLEVTTQAHEQGCVVLTGHAYDLEGVPPCLPFVEALREYVRTCPLEELWGRLGTGAARLAVLLPELREWLPDLPSADGAAGEYARYALFEAVADCLGGIARAAPAGLLLVLEDLHWADAASLLLLQHVVRRTATAPVLVAATYRSAEHDQSPPLRDTLAALAREESASRVRLRSLSADESAALIASVSGVRPAPAVAAAVYRETAGNPFFVGEVVRHLVAEGRNMADPGTTAEAWRVPEGVRQIVGRRLLRLGPACVRVLQLAAILGQAFPLDALGVMTALEPDDLLDALEPARAAGLVVEGADRYAFSHALVQQTLIEDLRPPRRQRLHARAIAALEALAAGDDRSRLATLAAHARLAGPAIDGVKAFDYAYRAVEAANAVYAWEEAAASAQYALRLLAEQGDEDDAAWADRRCELLLSHGWALMRSGDYDAARVPFRTAAAVARRHGTTNYLARAALGLADGAFWPDIAENNALLEEALAALGPTDSRLRARLLGLLAQNLPRPPPPARRDALTREALAVARRIDGATTLGSALHERHTALLDTPSARERLALADEIIGLAERLGSHALALQGYRDRIFDLIELGDIQALDSAVARFGALAASWYDPYLMHLMALWAVMRAIVLGRFSDVDVLLEAVRASAAVWAGADKAEWLWFLQTAHLYQRQGRFAEIDTRIAAYRTDLPDASNWFLIPYRALVDAQAGRTAAARQSLQAIAANNFAGLPGFERGAMSAVLARACAVLGDAERAEALYARLLPYDGYAITGNWGVVCHGPASFYLGLLAATMHRNEDAARHFDDALALATRMGAKPYLADTLHAYGALLLTSGQGDAGRGQAMLEQTIALYHELGLAHAAIEAEKLLAGPRARSAAPTRPAYPDGLSEREVEVLALLAGGDSNRAIAERLVLSIRTVERHVDHIYHKLGVHGRRQARQHALAHGLVRTD